MTIKVLTLNIEHGGVLWDEMIDFVRSEDADILLLQEFQAELEHSDIPQTRTLQEFRERFNYAYDDFAPRFNWELRGVRTTQGNAIFSKLPITERYEAPFFAEPFNDNYLDTPENFPHCPRNLQHVTIDVQGTPLDVFNFQGVWDLDGTNDSPQRLHMSDVIVGAVKDLQNVILAGDTNAQRNCQTIRNIEKHLTNVFGDELPTSFNIQRKDLEKYPGYATATVDMMFTSPHLKVIDHYCPQVDVSDHLPLVAIIEV
jgi:endonuclease/exonuclease/phosphatase family metal-dependent hydrolase